MTPCQRPHPLDASPKPSARRLEVFALGAVLALASCSNVAPSAGPPPIAKSDEASSAVSRPTTPNESGEEFVMRWIRVSDKMQNTGRVGEYLSMSRQCNQCMQFYRTVKRIRRNGGTIKTDGLTVLAIRRDGPTAWMVKVRSAPTTFKESKTSDWTVLDGGVREQRYELTRTTSGWQMTDYFDTSR